MRVDLTVAAIPAFIGGDGHRVRLAATPVRRREELGLEAAPGAGDYQLADTLASLSMGIGSLAAPFVQKKLLDPVTPGRGRLGTALMTTAVAATAITTAADVLTRRARGRELPRGRHPAHGRSPRDAVRRPDGGAARRHRGHRRRVDGAGGRDDLDRADRRQAAVRQQPPRPRDRGRWRRPSACSAGTSSTTGTTASPTRAGGSGRSTWSTTPASATTSRPRCASRSPRASR